MRTKWGECTPLFEPHFLDRMDQRFLSLEQVQTALLEGNPEAEGKKGNDGSQDLKINWNKWALKITRKPCHITLRTAFHD